MACRLLRRVCCLVPDVLYSLCVVNCVCCCLWFGVYWLSCVVCCVLCVC